MFDLMKYFRKETEMPVQSQSAKDALREKYYAFQKLLNTNNQVLELMADMEEKLSGEYLFDIHYIKTTVRLLGNGVSRIIENVNLLSKNRYALFVKTHEDIQKAIEQIIEYKMEVPVSDLTVPLEQLTGKSVGVAGGKIAHLGEIKSSLRMPAPDGFVISAYAFIKFMDHNRLLEKISEKLSALRVEDLEELNRVSREINEMITRSDIPPDLQGAVENAYKELCRKGGKGATVSVRSSAIREDSEFSFAGQYATFLNVPGDAILQKYKEVVASLFTPRALFYSKTKGFSESDMVMAVGVITMVDAALGGVMYSRNPNNPATDHILINAVNGLGLWVVDGTVPPDVYTVSRHPAATIIDRKIATREKMLVIAGPGDLKEEMVPDDKRGKPCLTDEQIKALSKYALELEQYYGSPQDVEWAIGKDCRINILQSRHLRTLASTPGVCLPTRIEGYNIILDKGVIACKGIGCGKAFVLRDEENLKDFPEGAILVAEHTSPKFVTVMNKAAAIITDVGSATGHMASLSREYQVPTILDTEVSTRILQNGQEVTVDAINCNVYEGRVEALIEYAFQKKEPFKETHLFRTLEKVLKWIVPLNVTDPDSEYFKPENCMTYHDITCFSHEMAMRQMFSVGEAEEEEGIMTIALSAGIPIDICILDIDGGVKENVRKALVEDILSIPFSALLRGMKTMQWPGPPPVDAKGFLGMLAHASSVPEDQLQETAKKSFAVISENYMNFSIRLGYHFSMIESYAGANINDNYIKFFFKGGGAALDRRLRRVRLIREILKVMGFKVNVNEDVVNAVLTKYKQSTIEDKLAVMGKLTAYTKQLDMAMFNDAVTNMYIEQFIKEHIRQKPNNNG
jgi:pyruvate,water dikinase